MDLDGNRVIRASKGKRDLVLGLVDARNEGFFAREESGDDLDLVPDFQRFRDGFRLQEVVEFLQFYLADFSLDMADFADTEHDIPLMICFYENITSQLIDDEDALYIGPWISLLELAVNHIRDAFFMGDRGLDSKHLHGALNIF